MILEALKQASFAGHGTPNVQHAAAAVDDDVDSVHVGRAKATLDWRKPDERSRAQLLEVTANPIPFACSGFHLSQPFTSSTCRPNGTALQAPRTAHTPRLSPRTKPNGAGSVGGKREVDRSATRSRPAQSGSLSQRET